MNTPTMCRLLRLPQIRDATGLGTTSIYQAIKAGLFPPPIKLTPRSSGWPDFEIGAINAAKIAGKSDDEIRQLVVRLVAERTQATS